MLYDQRGAFTVINGPKFNNIEVKSFLAYLDTMVLDIDNDGI